MLTAVRRIFEPIENLLPLHHRDRIVLFLEELSDRTLMRSVRFVLEAIDLDTAFQHALPALQRLDGKYDLVGGRGDDPRQLAHTRNDLLDMVERDERRRGVDRIHDLVERACK